MHSRFCGEFLVFGAQREKGNVYMCLWNQSMAAAGKRAFRARHICHKSQSELWLMSSRKRVWLWQAYQQVSQWAANGGLKPHGAVANLKSKLPGHFALLWSEPPASHCCQAKRNTKHPNTWLMFLVQLCLAYVWQGPPFHWGWETINFFNECFWLMLESICGFANSFCWFNFNANKREVPFYVIASSDKQQTLHSPLAFSFILSYSVLKLIYIRFLTPLWRNPPCSIQLSCKAGQISKTLKQPGRWSQLFFPWPCKEVA